MLNSSPSVFFFVALSAEAKPIIRERRLKKRSNISGFELYEGDDTVLTVSGIGKLAMAGAVAYTLAHYNAVSPILLNVGIAGHPQLPLGCLQAADKVEDADSGRVFYPQFSGLHAVDSQALKTWSVVQHQYQQRTMVDMEASGFYEMAIRFSSSELIHCLKIISDNSQHASDQIDAAQVGLWVEASLPRIDSVEQQLRQLRDSMVDTTAMDMWVPDWWSDLHFTVAQRQQWQALSKRRQLLGGEWQWPENGFKTAKQALQWLEQQLGQLPFSL